MTTTVWTGDCRDLIDRGMIPSSSVHLIVTSPPYAAQRDYGRSGQIAPDQYVGWFLGVAKRLATVLRADGSLIVNIKEHAHDGERSPYVYDLVLAMRRQAGWRLVDEFIWHKTNPMPGVWPDRLADGFERIYHFARSPITIRRDNVARMAKTPGKAHVIGSLGKRGWNQHGKIHEMKKFKAPTNVLTFGNASTTLGHPATFPVALPAFFIRLLTDPGDTVLDPFAGSGTTLRQAHILQRHGVGCEISPEYVALMARSLGAAGCDPQVDGK